MPAYVQFQIKLGFGETIVADGPCEVMKLQGRTVREKHPPHVNVTIVRRAKKRLECRRPSGNSLPDEHGKPLD